MNNVPKIAIVDDPLGSPDRVNAAEAHPPAAERPSPSSVHTDQRPQNVQRLERQQEANVSARVPAVLGRRLKIATGVLSATYGRVNVAELLAAVLAEHVLDADLEQLGATLERYGRREYGGSV